MNYGRSNTKILAMYSKEDMLTIFTLNNHAIKDAIRQNQINLLKKLRIKLPLQFEMIIVHDS